MKGIVFSFNKPHSRSFHRRRLQISDISLFVKRYKIHIGFVVLLLLGLVFGAISARNADSQLLNSLDFLFTTNLDARLSHNIAETFSACFASDFLFLFAMFLLGLAPWGIPVMPFVAVFKGFGTGLTAGFLISEYSFMGAGFYLIVLLPGTFLFCIAFLIIAANSFDFSKQMFMLTASKSVPEFSVRQRLMYYFSHSMSALIITFGATIVDTALWTFLSGAFNF